MAAARVIPFKVPRTRTALRNQASAENQREAGLKRAIDRAAAVLDRLEARAEACDKQAKALAARKKLACARAAAIEERILELMSEAHIEKLTGNHATLAKRPNALSLIVDDPALIPAEYLRTKTSSEPDKVRIKAALAQDLEVAGVRLVQSVSLLRRR